MADHPDARIARLRHDLANPLSAVLAEVQLLLLDRADLDEELRRALQTIEAMALRMREMLQAAG